MISQEEISTAKILIIDDQKLHSLYLEKILKQDGYKNIKFSLDPLRAIAITQEFQPDIIILDLIMPQLDGFQIMQKLDEFRKENYLPILVLSEDKSSDIKVRALQSGATDFLYQPYESIEMLFRIRNMITMRILHGQVKNQNIILDAKVKERTQELRETQFDIIRRLAQAAEFRDRDTGLHIIRMSQYCAKLGKLIGMNPEQCELLLHASPLHDVGKIGIPDSILLKPGPLTPQEREIMKTHTTKGAQLLSGSDSPVMKMAQLIAITHHEKWDGTGYPEGLAGQDIPWVGQICSVCDVFDALTTKRPYKNAWPMKDAIEEIIRLKYIHFNPELVDRFIEILPQIEEIKKKYTLDT